MKKWPKSSVVLFVFCLAFFMNVQAAFAISYICDITQIGGSGKDGKTKVMLTDTAENPEFTGFWFKIPKKETNYFLSILLIAISLDRQVRVSLTGTTNNEYIKSMYLLNP
jgi:hypothetical protein